MTTVGESRRLELVHDLVIKCREVVRAILQQLWTRTSSNKAIPKTRWLQEFQLSLKSIRDLSDDVIEQYIDQYVRRKRTTHHLYAALQATAHAFHRKKLSNLREDPSILIHFVRECALETARGVWYKPYMFFNMSFQKHLVVQAVEEFDALVVKAIEHVARQFTDELVLAEQVAIAKVAPLLKGGGDDTMNSISSSEVSNAEDLDDEVPIGDDPVEEETTEELSDASPTIQRQDSMSSRASHASWEQERDDLLGTFVPLKKQSQQEPAAAEVVAPSPQIMKKVAESTTRIVGTASARRAPSTATLAAYSRYLPNSLRRAPQRSAFFK